MDKKLILRALLEQCIDWERVQKNNSGGKHQSVLNEDRQFYLPGPYNFEHLIKRISAMSRTPQNDVKKILLHLGSVSRHGEFFVSNKIIGEDGRLVTNSGRLVVKLTNELKNKSTTLVIDEPRKSTSDILVSGFLKKVGSSICLEPINSAKFGDEIILTNVTDFVRSLVGSGALVVVKTKPGAVGKPTCGYGELIKVTDESINSPAVGIASVLADGGYSEVFPREVMAETQNLNQVVSDEEIEQMKNKYLTFEDWRDKHVVTVDPRSCKDMDDAIWCSVLPDGNFELRVAIALASHYIDPDSATAHEALRRGNSTYVGDKVCAMLPKELSNGICSINPGEDRLALGGRFIISQSGDVLSSEFKPVVVRSRHKMAYDTVDSLFYGKDDELTFKYRHTMKNLEAQKDLDSVVRSKSKSDGFIELSDSEPAFQLNEDRTRVLRVYNDNRTTAHKIVETAMLIFNEEFAKICQEKNIPIIYRVEPSIDPTSEERVLNILNRLGLPIDIDETYDIRKTINHALDRAIAKDKANRDKILKTTSQNLPKGIIDFYPLTRVLSSALVRCLPKAKYASNNIGHFATAKKVYTHMTSDVRRFCDLVNQWQFFAFLDGKPYPYTNEQLEQIAAHLNECEYNSETAERKGDDVLTSMYAQDRLIGKRVVASVSSINQQYMTFSWGAFNIVVSIKGSYGRYIYNKESHYVLDQNTGAKIKFGKIGSVVITSVDTAKGTIYGDIEYGIIKDRSIFEERLYNSKEI